VKMLHWRYPHWRVFRVCDGDEHCVIPGLYAMVGAAASLSGVTVSWEFRLND
jgi:chloride channel 3/4/5